MKRFKKKHSKIPRQEVIVRMLRRQSPDLATKYIRALSHTPDIIPKEIARVCLPEFDPGKRSNIRYYPDLHNFAIHDGPNRSLPISKFLAMFRPFFDNTLLDKLEHDLSHFRLCFHTTVDGWLDTYADENIDSCMTGTDIVRCYVHPQNKLALAALYAPGGNTLIARSIVNVDEKWWVRLFGDAQLLADKLMEMGYNRLSGAPSTFRMYGYAGPRYVPNEIQFPYFDFPLQTFEVVPNTHNPQTGLIEVIINPGNTP